MSNYGQITNRTRMRRLAICIKEGTHEQQTKAEKKFYAAITHQEFDAALRSIVREAEPIDILSIPGVYEIVSEYYNNDVLDRLVDAAYNQ